MNRLAKLSLEALVVGLMVVVAGSLVSFLVGLVFKTDLPPVCKDWNKFYVMEISLFFTGVAVHLFCELVGINAWYCKNGAACH